MGFVRVILVSAAAMITGSFQLYQNSVVPNLYQPLRNWLLWRMPPLNLTGASNATALQFEREQTAAMELGLINSINNFGALFGVITLLLLVDIPRARGLVVIGSLTVLNAVLPIVSDMSNSLILLLFHRVLSGALFAVGANVAAVLIGELAPTKYRGAMLASQSFSTLAAAIPSTLLATPFLLGTDWGWPFALAVGPALAIVAVVVLPFVPESPRYLFLVRQDEAATRRSIRFYQGADKVDDVVAELRSEASLSGGVAGRGSLRQLLKQPGTIRALLTISAIGTTMGLQGHMVIVSNLTYMLYQTSQASYQTASVLATCIIVSNTVPIFSSPYMVERFGRRPLLAVSSFVSAIGYAALVLLNFMPGRGGVPIIVCTVLALVVCYWTRFFHYGGLLAVFTESFPQVGIGPPGWIFRSRGKKNQQRKTRILGICCGRLATQLSGFISAVIFLPLSKRFGVESALALHTIGSLLASLIAYCVAPETKGKTFEQIHRQYFMPKNAKTKVDDDKAPLTADETGKEQTQPYGAVNTDKDDNKQK